MRAAMLEALEPAYVVLPTPTEICRYSVSQQSARRADFEEAAMTTGLTKPLAGIGEDGRHLYTCPLCEAMCGLEIHVEDGRVASIRGNRDDTWCHGHIWPKDANL